MRSFPVAWGNRNYFVVEKMIQLIAQEFPFSHK